jgi:hypothetical protein
MKRISLREAQDLAAAALALAQRDPSNPLVGLVRRTRFAGKELRRLEALALDARLGGLPEHERARLAAARVGRSPDTIRRWRRQATLHQS